MRTQVIKKDIFNIVRIMKKVKKKIEKRGGIRPNSGRKQKYGESTKIISFRVPLSQIDNVKLLLKNFLKELKFNAYNICKTIYENNHARS